MNVNEDVMGSLHRLTQILVDYASSWHFGVYEQLLVEAGEFNDGGMDLAKELDPKIQQTTDAILSFSDQYSELEGQLTVQDIAHLSEDMSRLGEALAERFELEDQLIEVLHTAHKDRV